MDATTTPQTPRISRSPSQDPDGREPDHPDAPAPRSAGPASLHDELPWSSATPSGAVATVRSALRWGRSSARRPGADHVVLARGAHLPVEVLLSVPTPWERRRLVDLARIIVVQSHLAPDVVFTRDSAAVLRGIPMLASTPDVHAVTPGRQDRLRAGLRAIHVKGRLLAPAVRVRLHHGSDEGGAHSLIDGIPVNSPEAMLAGLARFAGVREAVASVSTGLHLGTGFDRRRPAASRQGEARAKERLTRALEAGVGRRGCARGLLVVDAADAGCESIAEGVLVWFLHAYGARPWRTQQEVQVKGRSVFPDVIFAEVHVILEVEGFRKLGTTPGEIRRNSHEQMTRGSHLEAAGWRVVHLPASLVLGPPDELFNHLWAIVPEIFDPAARPSPLLRY